VAPTPMQVDRLTATAGFSLSDPQRLLPAAGHGPQSTATRRSTSRAQQRHPQSLLHWTKRMNRDQEAPPGSSALGAYDELNSSNPSVLAFVPRVRRGGKPWPRSGLGGRIRDPRGAGRYRPDTLR